MGAASVRARLLRLALLLLLPGLAISGLLTWRTYQAERHGAETALRETARALSQLVDREFVQAEVLLRTLAATQELIDGDMIGFDRLARATAVMGGSVVLMSRTGQELIDTRLPLGSSLPVREQPPDWDQEAAGQAFIAKLAIMPTTHEMLVLVVLPLALGGGHLYDLELIVPIGSLQAILTRQRLPSGWIAAIMDRGNTLVARSHEPTRFVGHLAGAGVRAGLEVADEGVRDVSAIDGTHVVMAFSRSPQSRWTVTVASPTAQIVEAARRSTALLILLGSAAIALGLAGALRAARFIAEPIEALALSARHLGEGQRLPRIPPGLAEADEVARAMHVAAATLVERRAALSELNASLAARVEARTRELGLANRALEEQRTLLDAILGQLPIAVLVHHVDGTVLFANAEARRMVGSLPTESWRNVLHAEADAKLRQNGIIVPADRQPGALARNGVPTHGALMSLERHDGIRIDLEISAAPLRDPDGGIVMTLTTAQDVTARLRAEQTRFRSQRLEAVGQLTGGVAHEFNNLLMAISGCLELLLLHLPEQRPQKLLHNAARAAERGARLTRQLLAFARRQTLHAEPVDLNALVTGMTELLQGVLGASVEVATELDAGAWAAMADPSQLELVLLNLAINARDAMPGGGRLAIRTGNAALGEPLQAEDPPPGAYAMLSVADSGAGMDAEVLARAFEPFFTTKEVGRGSGLGLPQVLGVAQQLGGGVHIDSVPGQGTTVSVYLPRAMAAPLPAARPGPPPKAASLLAGTHLLVVDDDAEVRQTVRPMLEEMGALVADAEDGAAALLHIRAACTHLVLADLTMPHMTGIELAAAIASVQPGLPVVLMTGYSPAAMGETGPHIRAILQKPFRAETLVQALTRALGRALPPAAAHMPSDAAMPAEGCHPHDAP